MLTADARESDANDNIISGLNTKNNAFTIPLSALSDNKWLESRFISMINKEVIDSINTAHKLSTLEALLRKVISEELRNISLHIPFEPDTDSASDENESSIMDFLESF